jgi:hypothetical protein
MGENCCSGVSKSRDIWNMEWRKPPLIEAISATVLVSILNLKLNTMIATKGAGIAFETLEK